METEKDELKENLISGKITLDEYNSMDKEKAEKQEESMHIRRLQAANVKPKLLIAAIGILAVLLAASITTNGFGFKNDSGKAGQETGAALMPADPSAGASNAPVTIVEYSDFECPFCARVQPALKKLLGEYEGRVRLVFRNYPLSFHNNAQLAAEAGECANEQGKFWELHDLMFENRLGLKESDIKRYADEAKLGMQKFNDCLASGKYKAEVSRDIEDGKEQGVDGTPAFFINGKLISGAQPYEVFKEAVDGALSAKEP